MALRGACIVAAVIVAAAVCTLSARADVTGEPRAPSCSAHAESCPHASDAAPAARDASTGTEGACSHHDHDHHHHHGHADAHHHHNRDDHDHDHHDHDHDGHDHAHHDHDHDGHDHDHHDHDGQVADWTAELEDPVTGEVREIRAVIRRGGLSYLSPGNFRSALVHSVPAADAGASNRSSGAAVVVPTVLVLLYKPGSDLCDEAQPRYAALAETVASVLNATTNQQQLVESSAFVTAVFRVDAFASEDELEAGGPGSGGDGADVIREGRGADLLRDVPAVVFFQPDGAAPTGIGMRRYNGTLDAKTVLLDLAGLQFRGGHATRHAAEAAIDALVSGEQLAATSVGAFDDGALAV